MIGTEEQALCPWTFSWPGDFRSILRDNGFRDGVVSHFKRPVKCDPVEWLRTFGKVYLDGITDLQPGDFAEAEISGADDYDLWAG